MSRKQPSFGGVAALFGDDEDNAASAPKTKKKQPSFGGVAGLFGDDEPADAGAAKVTTQPPTRGSKKAAPSFGGVAAMFGDTEEDEKPPSQIITKPKKPAGRQASFGGVAALFGEDDDDGAAPPPGNRDRPHGKQASFGGVASLFGSDETANLGSKVVSSGPSSAPGPSSGPSPPPAQKGGNRQQSFGGVASLFGSNDNEEEEEQSAPASKITGLFDSKPAAKPDIKKEKKIEAAPAKSNDKSNDTIGSLPPSKPQKKQRKGKRDPSVSGIASLFGDDDEDEQPDLKSESKDSGVKEVEIHKELNNQKEGFIKKQEDIKVKLDRQKVKQKDLEGRIKKLQQKRDALVSSKKILAQMTAMEMERMREIIMSSYVPATSNATAATVS